ncbi:hypothetical protein ACFL7M_03995 [Thermodesulfobacteriota bacterium]
MKYFYIFLLRLALSIILASVICMFFFKGIEMTKISLLAGIMLLLAYLFENVKKRDKD